eukprot:CFRG0744T1
MSNKEIAVKFHQFFDAGDIDRCCSLLAPTVELKTPKGELFSGICDVRSRMNHGVETIGVSNISRGQSKVMEDDYVRSSFTFPGHDGIEVTIDEKLYMDDNHRIVRIERKTRK